MIKEINFNSTMIGLVLLMCGSSAEVVFMGSIMTITGAITAIMNKVITCKSGNESSSLCTN